MYDTAPRYRRYGSDIAAGSGSRLFLKFGIGSACLTPPVSGFLLVPEAPCGHGACGTLGLPGTWVVNPLRSRRNGTPPDPATPVRDPSGPRSVSVACNRLKLIKVLPRVRPYSSTDRNSVQYCTAVSVQLQLYDLVLYTVYTSIKAVRTEPSQRSASAVSRSSMPLFVCAQFGAAARGIRTRHTRHGLYGAPSQ